MARSRKLLLTALVLGASLVVAGFGVFAAFTATTSNTGNSIASGTVAISDSDAGVAMYVLTNVAPGATNQKCIRVTYTGSLPSTVHLYRSNTLTDGTDFTLKVERGSGLTTPGNTFDCTGFTSAATIYTGALGALGTTYATGVDAKGSTWTTNNVVDYRFTIGALDDPTPNAHTTPSASGSHDFIWEADSN
jgi:hypothetical protein